MQGALREHTRWDWRFRLAFILSLVYSFWFFLFEENWLRPAAFLSAWRGGILDLLFRLAGLAIMAGFHLLAAFLVSPLCSALLRAFCWLAGDLRRIGAVVLLVFISLFLWDFIRPKAQSARLIRLEREQDAEWHALVARQTQERGHGVRIPVPYHGGRVVQMRMVREAPERMRLRHDAQRETLRRWHRQQLETLRELHRTGRSDLWFWLNRDLGRLIPNSLAEYHFLYAVLAGLLLFCFRLLGARSPRRYRRSSSSHRYAFRSARRSRRHQEMPQ